MAKLESTWQSIDGYVADVAYPPNLHGNYQPPWTDWQLERRGVKPPRRHGEPFTLVDLGCGNALGLIVSAASHPQGTFIGVDAMTCHIEDGRRLTGQTRLSNVRLHCIEFKDAMPLADGRADYVTAQGVLAWINHENRDFLLGLAVGWLRPGGVLTIGYNALPGWHRIAPFQKLVRELAKTKAGNSVERFFGAVEQIRQMKILSQDFWDWIDPSLDRHPREYFAHEYLNEWWNPLWSGDVVRALSSRGMAYVGQASHHGLRADLTMPKVTIEALQSTPDLADRELASDIACDNWYRQDIYIKLPCELLDASAQHQAMMERPWLLADPCLDDSWFTTVTRAGKIEFDTPCARAIAAKLAEGPAPLSSVTGFGAGDLINSSDAMFTAQRCIPVDPPGPSQPAQRVNTLLAMQDNPVRMYASPRGAFATESGADSDLTEEDYRRFGLNAV